MKVNQLDFLKKHVKISLYLSIIIFNLIDGMMFSMSTNNVKRAAAYDVFLSYSSKNQAVTNALCHFLEERKIRCWMAPRNILPGKEYGDVINQAIDTATIFVLVYSNDSLNSKWVRKETNLAVSAGKTIIPFRIDDCPLEGSMKTYLNDVHWIDAIPHPDQVFGKLAKAIFDILNNMQPPSPEKPLSGKSHESCIEHPLPDSFDKTSKIRKAGIVAVMSAVTCLVCLLLIFRLTPPTIDRGLIIVEWGLIFLLILINFFI